MGGARASDKNVYRKGRQEFKLIRPFSASPFCQNIPENLPT